MNSTGNTILITGGGSGIGRGLAESFHASGNTVIIAGRRRAALEEVTSANPGMAALTLDVADPKDIDRATGELVEAHPAVNILVNNAGIMRPETLSGDAVDLSTAEAIITTNLLGTIRMTAALLPHLRKQPDAAIINVSSGLAFVPMAMTPTYCATKAAVHSYSQSLRAQLRNTSIRVIEIIPPYVQTHLMGEFQASDPRAMPLDAFIAETMALLTAQPTPDEVAVAQVAFLRNAEAENRYAEAFAEVNSH